MNNPANISTNVVVRFAPSPTGYIHIGNARTALINWLYCVQNDGEFILRFDDTDAERSRREYANAIETDLRWLGISPHRIERQSERFASYDTAADKLREAGLLYPCYETPDELDRQRKRRTTRGLPPIYDRSALSLQPKQIAQYESEGRTPHWRFLLPNYDPNLGGDPSHPRRTEVHWDDVIRGRQTVDLASMSDPVLIRGDGTYLYTLPSVVDDIEMGVSHIIRGDDHVTNTGAQIALFKALGTEAPDFGHHNLLTTADGEGLSKRLGSLSLQGLRDDDYEPMAVASLAVLIGTSGPVEPMSDMMALSRRFDPAAITKSPAKFDVTELDVLNSRLVHEKSYQDAKAQLQVADADGGADFWMAVRGNVAHVGEAKIWLDAIQSAVPVVDGEDREFVDLALSELPLEPWDGQTWKQWTDGLKAQSGRKGRGLFMPLRKALTGHEHGPELGAVLPLIGRERTLVRLS